MGKVGIDIAVAKRYLDKGELVGIPTETVYGLAANALDTDAVVRIYEAKKRPRFNPLILHTDSFEKVKEYVSEIPEIAGLLAEKFWPGPLTLLLPKSDIIPDIITAGSDRVAIRIPSQPLTLRLLRELQYPVAAPSANPFGYISPTRAKHVADHLGDEVSYILDGGECEVGLESTIIGFEDDRPVVYRKGGLPVEALEPFTGEMIYHTHDYEKPGAPGMLKSHYAPRVPVYVGDVKELKRKHYGKKISYLLYDKKSNLSEDSMRILSPEGSLKEAAANLFDYLRQLEAMDPDVIIAEWVPDTGVGKAINDRLSRAASE